MLADTGLADVVPADVVRVNALPIDVFLADTVLVYAARVDSLLIDAVFADAALQMPFSLLGVSGG